MQDLDVFYMNVRNVLAANVSVRMHAIEGFGTNRGGIFFLAVVSSSATQQAEGGVIAE